MFFWPEESDYLMDITKWSRKEIKKKVIFRDVRVKLEIFVRCLHRIVWVIHI